MAVISGSVDRIVFRNSDTGFCVARFRLSERAARGDEQTTIVGSMPSVRPGEILRLTGEWQTHPVHGRNFRVEGFEEELPTSREGIERYLGSGVIRGVGPVTAGRIVDSFGDQTMEVIDKDPERLRKVAGISAKRLEVIRESWQEQKRVRELMMFLQTCGISVALAGRIYETYRERAVSAITEDPYQLAHDIRGIGFRTADAVAGHLGISKRSSSRYVAGLKYTLSDATEDGHVYLTHADLLQRAAKLLETTREELEPALLELLRRGDAVVEESAIYLAPFFTAESGAVRFLRQLVDTPSTLTLDHRFDPVKAVEVAGAKQGLLLAPKQTLAAEQALREKVSILTGGPGTGKTSTLRTVITALEDAEITYCLCAPTGRAAKRVAETTGRAASTIHRLLSYQPHVDVFAYDQHRPLPCEFVVVDEVSMLDMLLFYHLLKAIPPDAHVLLVGDADQLPAVGPGNVLRDLIASGAIPVVVLTDLFRQARGSRIVMAAHEINNGVIPEVLNRPEDDLFFVRADDDDHVVEAVKQLVRDRIPRRYSLDPVEDVQVITPMNVGPTGAHELNRQLQDVLNPPRTGHAEIRRGNRVLRLGDKVMQIRNNYDKDVFNGDLGTVIAVRTEEQLAVVSFPTTSGHVEVEYESLDLEELVLAYATSVHKAQGSEFPCVVMPLVTQHFILLQRNLLYTAITRARQLCVLVGSKKALAVAVGADHREKRNTGLASRLRATVVAPQPEIAH